MNPDPVSILSLISNLYAQVVELQAENERLRNELEGRAAQAKQAAPA